MSFLRPDFFFFLAPFRFSASGLLAARTASHGSKQGSKPSLQARQPRVQDHDEQRLSLAAGLEPHGPTMLLDLVDGDEARLLSLRVTNLG